MTTFETLYKSLVVSGALLAGSCAGTTGLAKVAPTSPSLDLDCATLCSPHTEAERFCPDPNNDGVNNCCWLMVPEQHPCCSAEVDLNGSRS
jgi:hypothetical protein